MDEGSYPYLPEEEANEAERKRFDSLAVELSRRLEAFADLSAGDRSIVLNLLRHAMNGVKKGTLKEFIRSRK